MHLIPYLFIITCLPFTRGQEELTVEPFTGTPVPGHRIIGGQIVQNRADFSYQVSLRWSRNNFHYCGASIIDSQHLLTAAHCVVEDRVAIRPTDIIAVVGDLNVRWPSFTTVTRRISHIFTHENYDRPRPFANDIAVLRVSEDLGSWTPNIRSINLTSVRPADGTRCIVSGWGITEYGVSSDELRSVWLPIVPMLVCRMQYPSSITSGMLCAGVAAGGKDSCQGDSGGPLVCNNLLAGIVSWGHGCALPGFSGVYTDVAVYRDWIDKQIARSSAFVPSLRTLSTLFAIISYITLT